MRLTACGSTTRRITWRGVMPSARAASHWPRSIETMPPRKTSAKNAADWIENVSTAATYGVISTWIRIGSAKKNQNSWTSGGVVRKTSITAPAGHASSRRGDSRISASTRPSGTPQASAAPVTFSVLSRPSASRSAFAQTGDDEALVDRCLSLRRWGRRSEPQLFGSRKGDRNFWEDLDGIRYDNLFIFDDVGWNFEPSEIGAAFGLQQLAKLEHNYERRRRSFDLYSEFLRRHSDRFVVPRQTADLETAWLSYVFLVKPDAGFGRSDLQAFLEQEGVETRTVWTGNAVRQPMMRGVPFRQPEAGLPNADAVMERGMLVPMNHALSDDDVTFVCERIGAFLERIG